MCKLIRQAHIASADVRVASRAGVRLAMLTGCTALSLDAETTGGKYCNQLEAKDKGILGFLDHLFSAALDQQFSANTVISHYVVAIVPYRPERPARSLHERQNAKSPTL
jgi:hypothetical protein